MFEGIVVLKNMRCWFTKDRDGVKTPFSERAGFANSRMSFLDTWLMATVAGAATMCVWGGISHVVLLKDIGFTRLSHEERSVSTLRPSLPGDGLYGFPRIDRRGSPTGEEQAAWEARLRAGPTGMLIYHATGDAPVSPKKLSVPFLSAVLAAGMVSYWLSLTIATYWRRVGL